MKKALCLATTITMLCTSHSAFCQDISIKMTNLSKRTLYLSASDHISASPATVPPNTLNQTVLFKNVDVSDYFEMYFGKFRGDESCTFAYEFTHGMSPAECPDLPYQISSDGQGITFK